MAIMFRNLQIGEEFEFSRSDSGGVFSEVSLATGPWVKVSARKYRHADDASNRHYRVGTINANVAPVIGQPTGKAMALFTATQWHSDQPDGINLLSLGSTRKLHSESHRAGCLAEIERNLAYSRESTYPEFKVEIPRLEDLRSQVQAAAIGDEWLTDAENNRINEDLYQTGALAD